MNELQWASQAPYPLLALLQLWPLAGAAVLWGVRHERAALAIGWTTFIGEMALGVDLYQRLDVGNPSFQLVERVGLLGPLQYHAGADGISVLFVLLAALVMLLVAVYLHARALPQPRHLLIAILLVESVLMSALLTLDLLWFVLAAGFEIALTGYLIRTWSVAERRQHAAARFFQFQGTGLLLLLVGTALVGAHHASSQGFWSFDLADLASTPVTGVLGSVAFYSLFYGFAIRTPLFPFHGWLPTVAQHGNLAMAPAVLLGVKLGLYGLVRFVFPTVPEAVQYWHYYVMAFAAAGIFYAAGLAFLQTNLRALLAFAVVSHTSLAVLGLFSLHATAFQGALLLAATFGLAATAMFFMVGFVFHRTQSTEISDLGGLIDRMPWVGAAFFVSALAIVGMPGTPGFDAAHLVLEAGIRQFGALPTVGAALANVAAAGFLLWGFQRAFLAPRPEWQTGPAVPRATRSENTVAGIVIAVVLISGFFMAPWMDLVEPPLKLIAARFTHG